MATNCGAAPRVFVERVEGSALARTKAAFAPLGDRIDECQVGGSGTVQVSVERHEGETRIAIRPGRSLRVEQRRCVLEALSTVDIDDLQSRASPSERASGFAVTLRVEW